MSNYFDQYSKNNKYTKTWYKVFNEFDDWIGTEFENVRDAIKWAMDFGGFIVKQYTAEFLDGKQFFPAKVDIVWKQTNSRYWKSRLSGNIYAIHEHFIPASDLYDEVTFEEWWNYLGNV